MRRVPAAASRPRRSTLPATVCAVRTTPRWRGRASCAHSSALPMRPGRCVVPSSGAGSSSADRLVRRAAARTTAAERGAARGRREVRPPLAFRRLAERAGCARALRRPHRPRARRRPARVGRGVARGRRAVSIAAALARRAGAGLERALRSVARAEPDELELLAVRLLPAASGGRRAAAAAAARCVERVRVEYRGDYRDIAVRQLVGRQPQARPFSAPSPATRAARGASWPPGARRARFPPPRRDRSCGSESCVSPRSRRAGPARRSRSRPARPSPGPSPCGPCRPTGPGRLATVAQMPAARATASARASAPART